MRLEEYYDYVGGADEPDNSVNCDRTEPARRAPECEANRTECGRTEPVTNGRECGKNV